MILSRGGTDSIAKCLVVNNKTLVKEGFDVTLSLKVQEDKSHAEENFLLDVEQFLDDVESIQLGEKSRQISYIIAGHLSHKTRDVFDPAAGTNWKLVCCHVGIRLTPPSS